MRMTRRIQLYTDFFTLKFELTVPNTIGIRRERKITRCKGIVRAARECLTAQDLVFFVVAPDKRARTRLNAD